MQPSSMSRLFPAVSLPEIDSWGFLSEEEDTDLRVLELMTRWLWDLLAAELIPHLRWRKGHTLGLTLGSPKYSTSAISVNISISNAKTLLYCIRTDHLCSFYFLNNSYLSIWKVSKLQVNQWHIQRFSTVVHKRWTQRLGTISRSSS